MSKMPMVMTLGAAILLVAVWLSALVRAAPTDVPRISPIWVKEVGPNARVALSGNGRYVAVVGRTRSPQSPRALTLFGGDGKRLWDHEFPPDEAAGAIAVAAEGDVFRDYFRKPQRVYSPHEVLSITGGVYRFSASGGLVWKSEWRRDATVAAESPLGAVAGVAATPDGPRVLLATHGYECILSMAVVSGDGKILSEFAVPASNTLSRVDLSPDGSYVLCSESGRLVARRLGFSEIWHRDGLETRLYLQRPISQDGKHILAIGTQPFISPKWDVESGRQAGPGERRYEAEASGWTVLDATGQILWGCGRYQVLPPGYLPTPVPEIFDKRVIRQDFIGGVGDGVRVLTVTGRRRRLLTLGSSNAHGGGVRTLVEIALPRLDSGLDGTMLSPDGSRVACLALKSKANDEMEAELSVFDGDGNAVWASVPGGLIGRGRERMLARLFMSDDGRLALLLWGETLYAFSEP